jgi:hypothetical protein
MTEYDIERLNAEFAEFRAAVPQVSSPGMDAARSTVRRRRRVRATGLSALAVLVVVPVTAYAASGTDREGPPIVVATAPASPSLSMEATPSPLPSASATPSPSLSPSPAVKPSPLPSRQDPGRPDRLGPAGYGALRLNMTVAEANATGLTTAVPAGADCNAEVFLRGPRFEQGRAMPGRVWFDQGRVAVIWAVPGVSTPEGITIGSTVAQVRRAYPKWDPPSGTYEGHGYVPAPGGSGGRYRIDVQNGKVLSVSLHDR